MNQETEGTVVLGFGPQEMDWIGKVAKLCGRDAVMDPTVARMAGANLAGGTPAALAALRQRLEAGAVQAQRQATPGLSAAATRWLASGERGMSSEAMFQHLTGEKCTRGSQSRDATTAHPYDPADLRRCRLLLEQVPELLPLLPKMAEVSPAWANLAAGWDEICATMDAESPDWRNPDRGSSAPKTYELIQRAIGRR